MKKEDDTAAAKEKVEAEPKEPAAANPPANSEASSEVKGTAANDEGVKTEAVTGETAATGCVRRATVD